MKLVLFRDDELLETTIRLAAAPEDTCFVELDEDADTETVDRRAAWLTG